MAKSGVNKNITIQRHTMDLLMHLDHLKKMYPDIMSETDWELLRICAVYHDLGKVNRYFQKKMCDLSKIKYQGPPLPKKDLEVPHNYLSPCFIPFKTLKQRYGSEGANIVMQAVYYHHDREAEDEDAKERRMEYVENYLCDDIKGFKFDLAEELALNARYKSRFNDSLREVFKNKHFSNWQKRYIMVKGLLHRLDYGASGGIEVIEKTILDNLGQSAADKVMLRYGKSLRPVQQYMMGNKDKNIIVEASTGIGKTEAALLWIDRQKAFYALPLQVSINAIYNRVHDDLCYKPASLLHSNALQFYIDKDVDIDRAVKQYSDARQLSEALTICTVDQLFKFVNLYNGFECILATLAYSKVVIDEIQMYSPEIVGLLIVGLKHITDMGGKYAIITATFPKCLYKLMEKYHIPVPEERGRYFHNENLTVRHRIKIMGKDFDFEKIKSLGETKKVLIICNTVNSAVNVYNQLKDNNVKGLLHSRFIKKDRAVIERKILSFAPNKEGRDNEPGIWISTQIVEASLDLDFDVLISEMCSIDSLLQRMGRVYRSRVYNCAEPNVYVVDNRNGVGSVIDSYIYDLSIDALKSKDGELLAESDERDDKRELMDMVYGSDKITESDYYKSADMKINNALSYKFYDLDKKDFRNIDSVTIMPSTIYSQLKGAGIIDDWEIRLQSAKGGERYKILAEIQKYTLSLSHNSEEIDEIKRTEPIIYKHSGIHLYNEKEYDFNADACSGVGLVLQKMQKQKKAEVSIL